LISFISPIPKKNRGILGATGALGICQNIRYHAGAAIHFWKSLFGYAKYSKSYARVAFLFVQVLPCFAVHLGSSRPQLM
jgi:hypothetical protein